MIVAIGTDIVEIGRIKGVLDRHGRSFAQRILCPRELIRFDQASNPVAYLAKRFAAKEALAKALGTGIGRVSWQDIETSNNTAGAPQFILGDSVRSVMTELGADEALLSLSDEQDYALAFVVLSKRL
ncbi:MAG: holo-ACP synthase [Gammaproteobacteria bacterium]|nr:MAG: holo-ACP synthase [Gammaproteobacteria bacterium]